MFFDLFLLDPDRVAELGRRVGRLALGCVVGSRIFFDLYLLDPGRFAVLGRRAR